MAEQLLSPQTLDPSPPSPTDHHADSNLDSADDSSSSDPSLLSRNSSFSRLNAQAPEFVPRAPAPPDLSQTQQQQQQQQPPLVVPPPPAPPALVRVFSPPPPPLNPSFHVPIQGPVPVPVHNHNLHHRHGQYSPHHRRQPYHGSFVDNEPATPPDSDHASSSWNGLPEEAAQKILNQVEYYFGDLNLATTDHLMRFINKDPDGYVPISVVSAFKKIKTITNSHSQLAAVLRNSKKLLVSEDGKKVRRLHPLTESDMEELQSRIVVAENLPEDHCYQNLLKIFSTVGSVNTIRTCQPQSGNGGGSSASRLAKVDNMLFSNKLHAFVEYGTVELAEKAVAELNREGSWRSGLRVRLLLRRTTKPSQAKVKKGIEGDGNCEGVDASTLEQQRTEKFSEEPSQQSDAQSHEHAGDEHFNEREGGQRKGRNRARGKGRGRPQSHHSNCNHRGGPVGTPPSNGFANNEQPAVAKQPPGPRMPDGTRGFTMGRGKPLAAKIA